MKEEEGKKKHTAKSSDDNSRISKPFDTFILFFVVTIEGEY